MDGVSNISEVIRAKERELQKIQDMRFTQLEKTIEERDQILLESSRRFEQLKDDFQYNLRLLAARDKEINRLESIVEKQGREREDLEQQIKNLLSRIEMMQQKEKERMEKFEQDKALSKRILAETKAVIESMQWSAEEDIRVKNNEISALKKDIHLLNRAKDEAIEIQRRDLTTAFEQIIQQREEQIAHREGELAQQISLLDQRFEKLTTENMSLKSTVRELKGANERNLEEIGRLEEINRQLNYQVEDCIRSKEQIEDSLKRQVANLQADLQRLQDQRNREKQDLDAQIERLKNEILRERDFRSVVEKRLEELQENSAAETFSLHEEIVQQQRRIHSLEQELDEVKSEKEQTLVKLGNKRVENETLSAKNRMVIEELESATDRNRRLEDNYQALENTITQLQKEYDHYKLLMDRELTVNKDSAKDDIAEVKRISNEQVQRLRQNHEEEIQKLRNLFEEKLQDKQKEVDELHDIQGEKYIHSNRDKDAEIAQMKIQVQVKEKALQDERMEAEALKLRLKALEAQLLSSTQEIKQLKTGKTGSFRPTVTTSLQLPNNGPSTNDLSLPDIPTFDMPSPMMSEDFNISHLQYPDSPAFPASKYSRPYGTNPYAGGIASSEGEFDSARYGFSPTVRQNYGSAMPPPPPSTLPTSLHLAQEDKQAIDAVTAENEMLKKVVKEMRQDIESLRTMQEQQITSSPQRITSTAATSSAVNTDTAQNTTPESVYTGMEQEMREEIERLRRERKKLMDTGNELRSALLKAQVKDAEETHEYLENIREENVGTVYQWIRGQDEPRGRQSRSRSRSAGRDDYFSHLRDPRRAVHGQQVLMEEEDISSLEEKESFRDVEGDVFPATNAADDSAQDVIEDGIVEEKRAFGNKPITALRRRQENPMAVIGNAISSRVTQRGGIYPATRPLSSAGPPRPHTADSAKFVVHKAPSGGYTDETPSTISRNNSSLPRTNSNRATAGQMQALEKLKQNQLKLKQNAEMKAEEEIRQIRSKVVNYADLKSREGN